MEKRILYQELARLVDARLNCAEKMGRLNPNAVSADIPMVENEYHQTKEWFEKHGEQIKQLVADFFPSGSGWDCGTKIDLDNSHADKLVLYGDYHHMNDGGFYDGWTSHTLTVTPSLCFDFHLRVSGRNRNEIKEYLAEMFESALHTEIAWDADSKSWKGVR
jgi:hypothetical protein